MNEITFRPLHRWPREETGHRKPSRFRARWSDTIELLKRELRLLRARNVVIQLDLREEDIRLDGLPRANARPSTPRVILSCETPDGPLSFPCDTWNDWQDNVRAIALTLEHLRAVDRYGVTKHREQYTGWRALPGAGASSVASSAEWAAQFIASASGKEVWGILDDPDYAADAYRLAAKRLHPDAGGSTEAFQRLQEAKRILDAHHGGGR